VQECDELKTLSTLDALEWRLDQLPGVLSTYSAATFEKQSKMLMSENSPKWFAIIKDQQAIEDVMSFAPNNTVAIFYLRNGLISESMGHHDSEIADDGCID
jgi:hypothetical protein